MDFIYIAPIPNMWSLNHTLNKKGVIGNNGKEKQLFIGRDLGADPGSLWVEGGEELPF